MSKVMSDGFRPVPTITVNHYKSKRTSNGIHVTSGAIPHLVHIELTYACNARCIFCYNPERATLGNLGNIDRIVQRVAQDEIPHVYLIGGEPSLVPVARLNGYIDALAVTSSVTIVTNGIKRLEGISSRLACFGVPIHGANAETHEFLNQHLGSFQKTLNTIRHYVDEGHDVRCIPVLTGYNYEQIYDIIALAASLGMESIFVDRYEDGGIGSRSSDDRALKPTLKQFKSALEQMIRARNDFPQLEGRVGFGTAIPYCLDPLLIREDMVANCGVGDTFCAINPYGEIRLCNQSQLVFGNILTDTLADVWQKPELDIFRDLSWVNEPCASCPLLLHCMGGCKVDENCSSSFCIDYAVRGRNVDYSQLSEFHTPHPEATYPIEYRQLRVSEYMRINLRYGTPLLVTRYQTVELDEFALELARFSMLRQSFREEEMVSEFRARAHEDDIRKFISQMVQVDALSEGA